MTTLGGGPDVLMAALEAAFAPTSKRCAFGRMLDGLSPELRTMIERLLANPDISTRKVHLALTRAGGHVGRDSVTDHRAQRCMCGVPR